MDAGNLGPVAEVLRREYPHAAITIVADNDDKPGREINPGVIAATKAAMAIDARLAIPPVPGDANDLAILQGADAVATMVAGRGLRATAGADLSRAGAFARGGARRAGAGAAGVHGSGPGLLARRRGGGLCGRSVARHRLAGLQRAADRRATAARPAGGRRARQDQPCTQRRLSTCWRPERWAPARWSMPCRATTSARSRSRRSRRSACGRCSGRDARRPTPRPTIPSG